jgi:ABC-type nitrate/sulfonate/bicarbonate transport system permease component
VTSSRRITSSRLAWVPDPLGILGVLSMLAAWFLVAPIVGPLKLSPPDVVARVFIETLSRSALLSATVGTTQGVLPHVWSTLGRTLIAATLGIATGVIVGYLMVRYRRARDFLGPLSEFARIVPPLVVVPFLILWFGTNPFAIVGVVIFFAAAYMRTVTSNAIANVPPHSVQFARTLGSSESHAYRTVILPAIIPELLAGIRVVATGAWGLMVVAELIGAQSGIGVVLFVARQRLDTPLVMVAIIWAGVLAVIVDRAIVIVGGHITRWTPEAF